MSWSRRQFLGEGSALLATTAAMASGLGVSYGKYEARHFDFPSEKLSDAHWPPVLEGLSIVHHTDLHADVGSPLDMSVADLRRYVTRQKVALIKAGTQPDKAISVMTGDYLSHLSDNPKDLLVLERYLEALSDLESWFSQKYYTEGNHEFKRPETQSKIRTLMNQFGYEPLSSGDSVGVDVLEIGGVKLGLVGLPDYSTQRGLYTPKMLEQAVSLTVDAVDAAIILTHNIEGVEPVLRAADGFGETPVLALAGHTHGGQTGFGWLDHKAMDRLGYRSELIEGLYRLGSQVQCRVSRGIGVSQNFGLRLGSRPEIPLLRLERAA